MRLWSGFSISLAAKCRFLFGAAVLLIIGASLFVPWRYMQGLVHDLNERTARHMAQLAEAKLDLEEGDWEAKQRLLTEWWTPQAEALQLPANVPQLIQLNPLRQTPPEGLSSFLQTSIKAFRQGLKEQASDIQTDEDGVTTYHYVRAVRSRGTVAQRGALIGVIHATVPPQTSQAGMWWSGMVILCSGALGGILAILVFYLVVQRLILSPVRELRTVAELASAGDLSVRSNTQTGDEFEELAATFNTMLSVVQASEAELRKINKSLDIRLGELAERNVALYEANRLKNEFLANISHELRTPLNSIIGFAELLQSAPTEDDGKTHRYGENILFSGRMLLEMINDLLDLAKIEAGKLELHLDRISPRQITEAVIALLRPLVDKKRLQLTCELADDLPIMTSDQGKIQQILYNLLSNAVKFTPPGGYITVRAQPAGKDAVQWQVSDTGPGIAPQAQERIFEKFQQADASATREHGGSGLGLAISKDLTVLLGGQISVSSAAGRGATFTLLLPVKAPEGTPAENAGKPRLSPPRDAAVTAPKPASPARPRE